MGLLNYTKRKGKRILDCICLTKSTKKTQQRHLPSPRFPPQQQVAPLAETKKKKKRFWRKKKDKANKKRTNNNNLVCQYDPQQQSQMCQRPAKKKRFWRLRKHKIKDKNKCASVNNPNSRKKKSSCWRIRKTKKKSPCPLKKDEAIQQSQGHCQNETDQARMKKRNGSCWRIRGTKKNKKNSKTTHNATSRLEEIQQPRPCQAQSKQSQMQPTRQFQAQQQKEKKKAKWRWNLCGVKKNKKSKRRHPNFGEPTYLYEETELRQQVNHTRKKKKFFLCWRRKSRKDKREKRAKREKREKREKKEKREQHAHRHPNGLARLVSSLSFRSDSYKHRAAAQEILRIGNDNIPSRVFTLDELKVATKNFSQDNLLGEGGFGRVYLGHIPGTNETIGVKQLDKHGLQGNREFLVEVLMLSLLHHPNLVNLLGYCVENGQRILVYEYMQLGSLQDHLLDHSRNYGPLDWGTRMKIAAGAAKGLEFLHDAANPPVIYRDLKASNILLGEGFHPKLSDFGLAKLGPVGEKTHVSTRVMGTYGYCAPEYALTGKLTTMSDVYSFGVVLLELITGRRAVDTTKPTREQILVHWAAPLFKNKNRYAEMADPLMNGAFPIKGLYQALAISAMCLQEEAESRPVISDVVTALQFLADPKPDIVDCSDEFYPPPGHPPSSSDAEIEMCDEDDF